MTTEQKSVLAGLGTIALAFAGKWLALRLGVSCGVLTVIHGVVDGILVGLATYMTDHYYIERALMDSVRRRP
jgi:hypothetical protein